MGNNFELKSEFKEFNGEKYIIYDVVTAWGMELNPTIILFKSYYDKLIKNKMKPIDIIIHRCEITNDMNPGNIVLLECIFNIVNCNCIYCGYYLSPKVKCKNCKEITSNYYKFIVQYKDLKYIQKKIQMASKRSERTSTSKY